MEIETLPVGDIGANCYLAYTTDRQGLIIDPGAEPEKILNRVRDLGLTVKYIVLTHGHLDHIGAVEKVRQQTGGKVLIHALDSPCLTDAKLNLSYYFGLPFECEPADGLLHDGEQIVLADKSLTVMHTAGHTAGGICLSGEGFVFSGDTLFAGSVGRTDFPGGCMETLVESIKNKLLTLASETKVYPGHGPTTTIEEEQRDNPYL